MVQFVYQVQVTTEYPAIDYRRPYSSNQDIIGPFTTITAAYLAAYKHLYVLCTSKRDTLPQPIALVVDETESFTFRNSTIHLRLQKVKIDDPEWDQFQSHTQEKDFIKWYYDLTLDTMAKDGYN